MIKVKTAEDVRQAFNYLTKPELDRLREIVEILPPYPHIVNIGAGAGTSGLLFAETRGDTFVHTYDITDESSPFGCLAGERRVFKEANLSHLLGQRWFQYHGRSQEFAKKSEGKKPYINLLFIDGDHSYEGCMGDMEGWWPLVVDGGYMAIHDYKKVDAWHRRNPDAAVTEEEFEEIVSKVIKPYPDMDRAVDDFMQKERGWSTARTIDSLIVLHKGRAAWTAK